MLTSLRHGLYLGGFLSAYGLIFRLMDLHHSSPHAWVFYLALPVAVFLSLRAQAQAGPQRFTSGLSRGSVVIVIGALIYAIYVYGFNAFIDDSLIVTVREEALAKIDPGDPKAASQTALTEQLTTPGGFAASIFTQLLIAGVIMVFVIAPFLRGKKTQSD